MALRMITVSPDGSVASMAEINLSALWGNFSSLEAIDVLSEKETSIVYEGIPQSAGQAPFMLRVAWQSGACNAKMFDSARYFRIKHMISMPDGLATLMQKSDRDASCILNGPWLEEETALKFDASERCVPDRLAFDSQNILTAGGVLRMPDALNQVYIGRLQ